MLSILSIKGTILSALPSLETLDIQSHVEAGDQRESVEIEDHVFLTRLVIEVYRSAADVLETDKLAVSLGVVVEERPAAKFGVDDEVSEFRIFEFVLEPLVWIILLWFAFPAQ